MKLVFINDSIFKYAVRASSAVGGAERQQWLLARALVAAKWSVSIGVAAEIPSGKSATIDGVRFVDIGYRNGHFLSAWYKFFLLERPNWCYWRGADHVLGPAVEIAKLANVKTIFSLAFDTDVSPRRALWRRPFLWPLYTWGLLRCDKIFVQHSQQLSNLARRYRGKAAVVPSIAGVLSTAKSHFKRGNYAAWVGVLRQPKRPDLLIQIAQRAPDIHFVVCGGPSTHRSPAGFADLVIKNLRNLPNVDFMGQVPPDTAQEIIGNSAVLVSTSDQEGFPNTFLQAWGSGTPVVSLKVDPNHVIERLGLGTVHSKIDDLIAQIRLLIQAPAERDDIGRRARQYVEAEHSEATVVAQFESAVGKSQQSVTCPGTFCEPSGSAPQ